MSDLAPVEMQHPAVTNTQRHSAALTIAEVQDFDPESTAYALVVLGLAEDTPIGLEATQDRDGITWRQVSRANA